MITASFSQTPDNVSHLPIQRVVGHKNIAAYLQEHRKEIGSGAVMKTHMITLKILSIFIILPCVVLTCNKAFLLQYCYDCNYIVATCFSHACIHRLGKPTLPFVTV